VGLLDRLRGRSLPDDDDRWLVIGLGNPEHEYGGTRHNVGADVVRRLAERLGASFKAHKKAQAQVADTHDRGTPLSLVVPFGYMNRSGGPVQQAMAFYKVPHDRLIVVDVEPQHVVVQGAEGAPPYRTRCIRAPDSPPLTPGDTVVVTNVNPSSDLTVVARVAPGAHEGHVYELSEYQPAPGPP
jgi:hypothetical protein